MSILVEWHWCLLGSSCLWLKPGKGWGGEIQCTHIHSSEFYRKQKKKVITSSFLLWFFSLYSPWFDWPTISRMYSSLFPLAVTLHSRGKSNGLSIGCPLKHLQGPCSCHILSFLGRVFKSIKCHSISKWGFSYKHHFKRGYISHCRRMICHYLSKESRETGHVRKAERNWRENQYINGKMQLWVEQNY